ncbi:MAG: ABC transporter ATP-binding protein [Ilumatobacteraceae bacterium]
MTFTPAVEIHGLTKRFGTHTVLDQLHLDIGGGIVALLGRNGAGKTTLINVLATLLHPDVGTARVFGHDVVREGAAVRRLIGVTGQFTAVDEQLTGRENLVMMGRLFGLRPGAARRRADDLLDRFDLAEHAARRAGSYSGGMRRRLDLAISLLCAPRLIVLDEPTTGLDTVSRSALWDEVRHLATREVTVLLTTQYLEEADALADRVVVLDAGRIVADGSPDALKARVGSDVVDVLDPLGRTQRSLPTDGTAAGSARVLASLAPSTRVLIRRPTMDEVFVQLTSGTTPSPDREEVAS